MWVYIELDVYTILILIWKEEFVTLETDKTFGFFW